MEDGFLRKGINAKEGEAFHIEGCAMFRKKQNLLRQLEQS